MAEPSRPSTLDLAAILSAISGAAPGDGAAGTIAAERCAETAAGQLYDLVLRALHERSLMPGEELMLSLVATAVAHERASVETSPTFLRLVVRALAARLQDEQQRRPLDEARRALEPNAVASGRVDAPSFNVRGSPSDGSRDLDEKAVASPRGRSDVARQAAPSNSDPDVQSVPLSDETNPTPTRDIAFEEFIKDEEAGAQDAARMAFYGDDYEKLFSPVLTSTDPPAPRALSPAHSPADDARGVALYEEFLHRQGSL